MKVKVTAVHEKDAYRWGASECVGATGEATNIKERVDLPGWYAFEFQPNKKLLGDKDPLFFYAAQFAPV